ncbi:unnamed protein product [Symbiodinium natans]|uniref:Uncharacterized protein n=1 Tax=Symbiodinium natans TaxID=878477 RepID=A0A812SQK8_9DINO|nr:unnamed protein product [Symbiodinium natans]
MATLKDPPPLQPVRCWEDIQESDEKRNATTFDRRWRTTSEGTDEERKEYRQSKAAEVRHAEGLMRAAWERAQTTGSSASAE